jgi:hypothetical protein
MCVDCTSSYVGPGSHHWPLDCRWCSDLQLEEGVCQRGEWSESLCNWVGLVDTYARINMITLGGTSSSSRSAIAGRMRKPSASALPLPQLLPSPKKLSEDAWIRLTSTIRSFSEPLFPRSYAHIDNALLAYYSHEYSMYSSHYTLLIYSLPPPRVASGTSELSAISKKPAKPVHYLASSALPTAMDGLPR